MDKKLETLYDLCEKVSDKLEECKRNLDGADTMTVQDIDVVDKLAHAQKCLKTTIAMIESEEDGGSSRRSYRSYADRAMRSRDSGSYADGDSYAEDGYSERRGRNRMGRYTSRDGGYSGHDGVEDIMMDVRQMPESERRKLKSMLERM